MRSTNAVGKRNLKHGLTAGMQLTDLNSILRRQYRIAWDVARFIRMAIFHCTTFT